MHNAAVQSKLAISAEGLVRRFGEVTALDNVSVQIREGEFFSLLGPSGCGKTTLLRMVAGLDFPDSGSLSILGRDAGDWPAHARPVNTVFQSYALFPHLSVFENIAFGLRMKKVAAAEITGRVRRVMELVQIANLEQRRPQELSGGQKQRVALARAIVNEPRILLLDEPLGALDLKLRRQLQVELHQLQKRLGITFIYVTHDQDEALTMSDRIAVMDHGRIVQLDTPEELYEHPKNRFVAQFLGSCNLIDATVLSVSGSQMRVSVGGATVGEFTVGRFRKQYAAGTQVTLGIRPEKIALSKASPAVGLNEFSATISDVIYSGAETTYFLRDNEREWKGCLFNSPGHEQYKIGDTVTLRFPPEALIVLED